MQAADAVRFAERFVQLEADVKEALSAGFRHVYWFDTATVAPIDVPSGTSGVSNFAELTEKLFL